MEAKIQNLGQYFIRAFKDVMFTMSGVAVTEIHDQTDFGNEAGEISGLMVLTGKHNILVTLSMSANTATTLMSSMTGSPAAELPPKELYDGVAELVNMVAGQAKTIAASTSCRFKLTSPFTVVGKDHFIVHKSRITTFFKYFNANRMEFMLKLYFM
jgi:chemotaxis protein CheX